MDRNFVLKGDICYSAGPDRLTVHKDAYLVCVDGISQGVFPTLPERFASLPLSDHSGKLIIPGLTDLHMHAPQYSFRALGMDMELLEWLERHAFPEEAKFNDLEYAERAYRRLAEDLVKGPNTRICLFGTLHVPATQLLMDIMEESGLVTMVGKVNMDRNSPESLREKDAFRAAADTRTWLEQSLDRYTRTRPILTPRFIPACSDELMRTIAELQREFSLPLQSHLSENPGEISWVAELCPQSKNYADAYAGFGLFGGELPAVMAHCVWCGEDEIKLMAERGVYVAHCPQSNTNLSSGIAPVRRYLDRGLKLGLGSDIAGGCHGSIFKAMTDAIQVSKLHWRLVNQEERPLTVAEAFHLGTLGGASFFGKAGSFAEGYELDALIIDDSPLAPPFQLNIEERLARVMYLSDDRHVAGKYVRGARLF